MVTNAGRRVRLPLRGTGSQPVALSGAWTSDDTFTVKICFYETPHTLTLQLKFTGDEVRVDSEMNVDFGTRPPKYPSVVSWQRQQPVSSLPGTAQLRS